MGHIRYFDIDNSLPHFYRSQNIKNVFTLSVPVVKDEEHKCLNLIGTFE